jgi:hypothetical protein
VRTRLACFCRWASALVDWFPLWNLGDGSASAPLSVCREGTHMRNEEVIEGFEDVEVEPLMVARPKRSGFGSNLVNGLWKYIAAGNAVTPAEVLAVLATDKSVRIRRRCAGNPNANGDTLALLANDTDESVRAAVAANMHTPLYVLRQLVHDESASVRFAIAANPEMPDAILLSLFLDPDPMVADRASQTMAA